MTAPAAGSPVASPSAGSPAVVVDRLARSYAGRRVLDGVSFEVGRGKILAVLGPNGAGKTTTVEIVEGYRRADDGRVRVLGADPWRAGREHRARVGLMLQGGGGIDPRLTPREAVALFARFHARPRGVDEVLRAVGLSGTAIGTRYRRLSGGERQRTALAIAIVGRPELAILDEPTAGLDVEGRGVVRELISGLAADGAAVLLTSHDLADVERVADRIAVLDRGRIVAAGPPGELVGGALGPVRLRLDRSLTPGDREALAARLAATASVVDDGGPARYRIDGVAATPDVVAAATAWSAERGLLVLELRTTSATLEERYLELIGDEARP
jgi:ABC-2 type transport system ATP-binding protein